MTARQQFDRIQQRYASARERIQQCRDDARRKYGPDWISPWLTATERGRLDRADAAADLEMDRMFDLLAAISPRDWRHGVAAWWVMERLTYDDAVTEGALSVVPQAGYGFSQYWVEMFARALTPA